MNRLLRSFSMPSIPNFMKNNSNTKRTYKTWTFENVTKDSPVFTVTTSKGFLPREDPLVELPEEYAPLDSLLKRMPLTINGEPGLLGKGQFGEAVKRELPLYDMSGVTDGALLMALFRDYTFAASAYLLEPCDLEYKQMGTFGLGRDHLPPNIAVPLTTLAGKINSKPYMEYAQSYALYNYKKKDATQPLSYDNMELIRQFSGLPSESGFILVHVEMVSNTGNLIKHITKALDSIADNNRFEFNVHMNELVNTMQKINECMEKMWKRSSPADYMKFRTFILGTKNQNKIFPNGVIYEGTNDLTPRYFRGESGANDSIIPAIDNFLELTKKMPKNEMTDILKDFRSYRPEDHKNWLAWVEESATNLGVEKYAEKTPISLVYYMMLMNEVRDFRARHWNFAKEYIIKRTQYPTATGGSPMATWLPNQLNTVLTCLKDKYVLYEKMRDEKAEKVLTEDFYKGIVNQINTLNGEVGKMTDMYGRYNKK